MKRCFYQIFRPTQRFYVNGWGDCVSCTLDKENNRNCVGYQPINLTLFNVEEEDEQGQ